MPNGDLVSIHSAEQEAAVRGLGLPYEQTYWIGLHDSEDGGRVWSDGPTSEYTPNWGVNHPESGQCAVFDHHNEKWWDVICHFRQPFICIGTVGQRYLDPTLIVHKYQLRCHARMYLLYWLSFRVLFFEAPWQHDSQGERNEPKTKVRLL